MEFGKVHDVSHLDLINWHLPKEDMLVPPYLQGLGSTATRLFVGAPAWSHKEWVGKIYPAKTKAADYLYHYSRYFNTIELNTTHYGIPTPEKTQKWLEKVPENFVFCPKVYQGISHEYSGLTDSELLHNWFEFLQDLGSHCGPSFIQFPPHFDYNQKALLFKFLQLWPEKYKLALEFRHPSWFQGGVILPALTQYLQSRGIGLVITDVAGRRDVLHSSVSAPFVMVRFIGNELHASDYIRAEYWNERLTHWSKQGLKEVYFFIHEPDDVSIPEMMEFFKSLSFFKSLNHKLS
jgi:uncharacterized protein YecE (DUF72 family)